MRLSLGRSRGTSTRDAGNPARVILGAFATAVLVITGLLMLPLAHEGGEVTSFRVALFTATSAVCVTGLAVVDTPTYWSTFGEVTIIAGVHVGGFGIMTLASLLSLFVSRRLGLRSRLLAQAESQAMQLGDLRFVLQGVAAMSLLFEGSTALLLWLRLWLGYDLSPGRAAYEAVFHAISAFNHGGFALYSDSVISFNTDPWVLLPMSFAIIAGSLGYPVMFELRRELRTPSSWSVLTRITVLMTGLLLSAGTVTILLLEWTNPGTLGPMSIANKVLNGFFQAVTPRSAGFNSVDYVEMREATWLVTDALMFIGGGSASTAGGIKLTTFTVLLFAIIAEARGDTDINAFHRQISASVVRQSIAVALISIALIFTATLTILVMTNLPLDRVLFEVISASATVGLSVGLTPSLPPGAHYVLVLLMFLGRIGPITLASALALRQQRKLYRLPEERPIVG